MNVPHQFSVNKSYIHTLKLHIFERLLHINLESSIFKSLIFKSTRTLFLFSNLNIIHSPGVLLRYRIFEFKWLFSNAHNSLTPIGSLQLRHYIIVDRFLQQQIQSYIFLIKSTKIQAYSYIYIITIQMPQKFKSQSIWEGISIFQFSTSKRYN